MTIFDYFKKCWSKSFSLEGRASRSEYWSFVFLSILIIIVGVALGLILLESKNKGTSAFGGFTLIATLLFFLASIPAGISAKVRRLHDIGYSGAWFFISFVPFIGGIWSLILSILESQHGRNQYGENPWGIGNSGKFCPHCGGILEINEISSFCPHCGKEIKNLIDISDQEKKKEKDIWA